MLSRRGRGIDPTAVFLEEMSAVNLVRVHTCISTNVSFPVPRHLLPDAAFWSCIWLRVPTRYFEFQVVYKEVLGLDCIDCIDD